MRTIISRYAVVLAVATAMALVLIAAPARASEGAKFKVIVVKATNDGQAMDASLQEYANLLKNKGFNNFAKVSSASFSLKKDASKTVGISGGLKVTLTFLSEVNNRVAFKYQIFVGQQAKPAISHSIPRGGKTVLIIPLSKHAFMLIIEVD